MIKNIKLTNIRNHDYVNINLDNNFIYIKGNNGSGKTTILESIYFASSTKSHRTNTDLDLVKRGMEFGIIDINTEKDNLKIIISEQGKIIKKNNVLINKLSDVIGIIKTVIFSPEDLMLIKGSPSVRRNFLDLEILKLDKKYLYNLSKYKKILRQRNALLKSITINDDYKMLNIISENLYNLGIELMKVRNRFINKLNEETNNIYKNFSTNKIAITYTPNVTEDEFYKYLTREQKRDILLKSTQVGPHRDDFTINFNNKNSKTASQGEIRLIVISMKLALTKIIKGYTKDSVVLLLDDVLSELDENVKDKFINNLPENTQIIMNSAVKINNKNNIKIIEMEKLNV